MNKILSDLIIKRVLSVNTMFNAAGANSVRTNRDRWAVAFRTEGETRYTCKGKTVVSNALNIVILPAGCNYRWECKRSGNFYMLEFEAQSNFDEVIGIPVTSNAKISAMFIRAQQAMARKNEYSRLETIHCAYELLYTLLRSQREYIPSTKANRIKPVIEYIALNYNENISNDALASITGVSTVYFRRIFKEATGLAPIEYLHKMRIEKAKEMLRSDYGKISDIAIAVGYGDIYHFSKMFKIHTGYSPKAFANTEKK